MLKWHPIFVGPYQEFAASLPDDSPELQFGMFVYENGVMKAEQTLTVTGITIENEGSLKGVENLVIGPNGKIILRYVLYLSCRYGYEVLSDTENNKFGFCKFCSNLEIMITSALKSLTIFIPSFY